MIKILSSLKQRALWYYHQSFVARRKTTLIIIAVLAVGGSIYGGITYRQHFINSTPVDPRVVVSEVPFTTLLPAKKSAAELGGWHRISPAGSTPVYAYTDTLASVSISVSQQPLPPNFTNNVANQTAELAKKFNATTRLTTNDNTPAFLGSSSKGPQSVILAKKNLLIMLKSQQKISTSDWSSYIDSLQ